MTNCTASGAGGAVYVDGFVDVSLGLNGSTADKDLVSIAGCTALQGDGGGLYIADDGNATLDVGPRSEIVGCSAVEGRGAAVFITGASTIQFSPTAVIKLPAARWGDASTATATEYLIYVGTVQQRPTGLPQSTDALQSNNAATAVVALSCAPGSSLIPIESTTKEIKLNFFDVNGTTSADHTDVATYSTQLMCQRCTPSTYSLGYGTDRSVNGTKANMTVQCQPCPAGSLCFGGDCAVAEDEYWVEPWSRQGAATSGGNLFNITVTAFECIRCAGCVSIASQTNIATLNVNCETSGSRNRCKDNRVQPPANASLSVENPLCGACIRNESHTFIELGGDCVLCNKWSTTNITLTAGGYVVYVSWVMWMATADISTGLFNIALYFVQVLGLVLGPVSKWAPYLAVLGTLDVSKYFCLGPMTKVGQLWWGLLSPLVYFTVLGAIIALNHCIRRCKRSRPPVNEHRLAQTTLQGTRTLATLHDQMETDDRLLTAGDEDDDDDDDRLIGDDDWVNVDVEVPETAAMDGTASALSSRTFVRCACYLMLFSYDSWTEQSLQLLNCIDVGNRNVVAEQPDVSCTSTEYRYPHVTAIVLTGLVVVGFPVGLLVFLSVNSYRGNLQDSWFQRHAGVLYEHYNPAVQWWWLPQELLRRTLLITLHMVSSGHAALRAWLLGVGCAVIFGLHVWFKPYHSHHNADHDAGDSQGHTIGHCHGHTTCRGWRLHARRWWQRLLDPNLIETVTLFMLMVAAFTNEIVGEGEGTKDARALFSGGDGKGFMFWVLILTISLVCIPVTWEFLCADTGVFGSFKRLCRRGN